jgi:arylsulfatase
MSKPSTPSFSRRTLLAGAASGALSPAAFAQSRQKPLNLVMIYCDDLGYGDLGCYGSPIPTPNIDSLAKDGLRFTDFHSGNPVCSPSRSALLTGRHNTRVNVPRVFFPRDNDGLPTDETTFARMAQKGGYATACVGKWHLGHKHPHLPTDHGFDEYFGIPYSNDMNPRWLMDGDKVIEEQATLETLTPRYTDRAVRFIEKAKDKPFVLYMPHTYPHIPLAASARFRGKSEQGLYGDVIQELDWSVGEVLRALRLNGVADHTLVVFSSDNGPWYQGSSGRLRGRKGMTTEGGMRVPGLARLPGVIPAGRTTTAFASVMDILPTFASMAGLDKPAKPLDGVDIGEVLRGYAPDVERTQPFLYFDGWDAQCSRMGKWKLHFARRNDFIYSPSPQGGPKTLALRPPELYNLALDPDESYDVAPENPQVVERLMSQTETMLAGFPQEVRDARAKVLATETAPPEPGRLPREKAPN